MTLWRKSEREAKTYMQPLKLVVEETRDGARISWTFKYDTQPTPKLPQKYLISYLKELTARIEAREAVMVGFAQDSVKQVYRDELLVERRGASGARKAR